MRHNQHHNAQENKKSLYIHQGSPENVYYREERNNNMLVAVHSFGDMNLLKLEKN